MFFFFFSSRRRHTRFDCDWSSDVCSSDLTAVRVRGTHASHILHNYARGGDRDAAHDQDRKSTRLNSSHSQISYAVFFLKKKKTSQDTERTSVHGRAHPISGF